MSIAIFIDDLELFLFLAEFLALAIKLRFQFLIGSLPLLLHLGHLLIVVSLPAFLFSALRALPSEPLTLRPQGFHLSHQLSLSLSILEQLLPQLRFSLGASI